MLWLSSNEKSTLFSDLEAARQMIVQAEKKKNEIDEERVQIEKQLKTIREQSSSAIDQKDAIKLLLSAAINIGLNITEENSEKAKENIEQFRSVNGRVKLALLSLLHAPDRWLRIALLIIVLILTLLFPLMLNWLLSLLKQPSINEHILQVVTFIAGMAPWFGSLYQKILIGMNKFDDAQKKVDSLIKNARQPLLKKEEQLTEELDKLNRNEDLTKQSLLDAKIRLAKASAALERAGKIDSGQSLIEFIRGQTTNDAFLNQLGIVSLLRQNLEGLSTKLEQASKDHQSTEASSVRIDRIILYIDDLDRCNEKAVADVLQAVHLLLAFKLFIVVVGVDSRWLLHSLEKAYPALLEDSKKRDGWSEEELQSWESTPQNYLEKIFQVPYNLRPMDTLGYSKLLNSILPITSNGEQPIGRDNSSASPAKSPKDTHITEEKISSQIGNIEQAGVTGDKPKIENFEFDLVIPGFNISLNPEFLKIEPSEQEFSRMLSGFLPTPRAVKRFVNTYRLIRATIRPDDLQNFIGGVKKSEPGEFSAVMVLLAILTGFPRQAPRIFQRFLKLNKEYSWSDAVKLIKPRQLTGEEVNYCNGILPHISPGEAPEWKRIFLALSQLDQQFMLNTMDAYKRWIPQVSRFSFRVGKIVSACDLSPDIQIVEVGSGNPSKKADKSPKYLLLKNLGDSDQNMSNWILHDNEYVHTFVFSAFVLTGNSEVKIWEGVGNNTKSDLFWNKDIHIWNKSGDVATLCDDTGNRISTFTIQPNVVN